MRSELNLARAKRTECRNSLDGMVALLTQDKLSPQGKAGIMAVISRAEKILYDGYVDAQNDAIKVMTDNWEKEMRK